MSQPPAPGAPTGYEGPPAPQHVYPTRVNRLACVGFITMLATAVHTAIQASLAQEQQGDGWGDGRQRVLEEARPFFLPPYAGFASAVDASKDDETMRQLDAIAAREVALAAQDQCVD